MRSTTIDILADFLDTVDRVYGLYLDSVAAYKWARERFVSTQQDMMKYFLDRGDTMQLSDLDEKLLHIGKGDLNSKAAKFLHKCTQGEYKSRNAEGGFNHLMIANQCLVLIYQYWEDRYRKDLAADLSVDVADISVDTMGDIRLLRHSIVHHRGIALPDVAKCRIVTKFKEGDVIDLSEEEFETMILEVKKGIVQIAEGNENELAEAFERHIKWPY